MDSIQEHLDRCANCLRRFVFQGGIKRLVGRTVALDLAPEVLEQGCAMSAAFPNDPEAFVARQHMG